VANSVFLDFHLPNGPTWFYMSAILAIALFFKFNRVLSLRNWDLLTLFLLVPGLLLLNKVAATNPVPGAPLGPATWWGYVWLLGGSAYYFVRCLLDLVIVRRPALEPNLNRSGLAWLMVALFACLAAVAVRALPGSDSQVGQGSTVVAETTKLAAEIFTRTAGEPIDGRGTQFWVTVSVAGACHLAVIAALIVIGLRHFQDLSAGMAAATLYLLLPYISFHVAQIHHVWPTALLLWAIVGYRRPTIAGLLIGVAAGTLFFPALTLPIWLSFYGKGNRIRFGAAAAVAASACLALAAWFLWLDGSLSANVQQMLGLSDWQPWQIPTEESFWRGVHWAYRIPLFLVYMMFVIGTAFWPSRKNLAQLISLCAAVLIGVQFWYANHGGVYVLWYLPLLLLLMYRPNLNERFAPPDSEQVGFIERAASALATRAIGLFRRLRPPTHAGA
jgi:hypothetical protein